MLWCSEWCLIKMVWKASLKGDACTEEGMELQIPFCWQIQRGSGNSFNCCSKSRSWCLSSSSHTNRHKWTFSRMDRQLLRQVDASALFCCDIIQDFKGSKAQTVKIPFFHSSRKWKNSLSLIYENISSEEAAKQRAKRENSKIRQRQHADKEANETVLKENRSQGGTGGHSEAHSTFNRCSHSLLIYNCQTKYFWCW